MELLNTFLTGALVWLGSYLRAAGSPCCWTVILCLSPVWCTSINRIRCVVNERCGRVQECHLPLTGWNISTSASAMSILEICYGCLDRVAYHVLEIMFIDKGLRKFECFLMTTWHLQYEVLLFINNKYFKAILFRKCPYFNMQLTVYQCNVWV